MNDQRQQLEDQLLDQALQEKVGSESPPDLSAQILASHRTQPSLTQREQAQRRASRANDVRTAQILALGLVIALVVVGYSLRPQEGTRTQTEMAAVDKQMEMIDALVRQSWENGDNGDGDAPHLRHLYLDLLTESVAFHDRRAVPLDGYLSRDVYGTEPQYPYYTLRGPRDFFAGTVLNPEFGPAKMRAGAVPSVYEIALRYADDTDRDEAVRWSLQDIAGEGRGTRLKAAIAQANDRTVEESEAALQVSEERLKQLTMEVDTLRKRISAVRGDRDDKNLAVVVLTDGQKAAALNNLKGLQDELSNERRRFNEARANFTKTISVRQGQQAKKPEKKTWRRAKATPNASRLVVGEKDELLSDGAQIHVTIDGFRVRVLMDLFYYNDRDRQLEGQFKLRLPNDASLYYFAFGESEFEYKPDVDQIATREFLTEELLRAASNDPGDIRKVRVESWRNIKEARIVPREKASFAYSETVRRKIDPALVEWAGAGMFNAKVFPLMPHKLHRIVVGYDVNLQHDGEDLAYSLELPSDRGETMVDLDIAALAGLTAEVTPATRPFSTAGRAYYRLDNPKGDAVRVKFPRPGAMLLVGEDKKTGGYFATEAVTALASEQRDAANDASSTHALFLLDNSLSSQPARFNRWLDLLQATLTNNRPAIQHFNVLCFNIESHRWQPEYVENTPENVGKLIAFVNTLTLEGATDLGNALLEVSRAQQRQASEIKPDVFLLSDGAVTWGETNLHLVTDQLRGHIGSLFAYQTGLAGTDSRVLEHLARETGGAVFSVTSDEEVTSASTAHRQRPWQLLHVEVAGGSDLMVAGRPKRIYPGQRLQIVGRGHPKQGEQIVLHVRRGEETRELKYPLTRVVESNLTPRLYGQVAVGQLEELASATEDVAVAYARHFRVTGQSCSLLMLESEEDYQRFEIKPEDDAFVVKSTPAFELIQQKIDELSEQFGDPKASLLAWVSKLEGLQGVNVKLSAAFKLALERLPADAFRIETPALRCQARKRSALTEGFLATLQAADPTKPLDYDQISAEATRRQREYGASDALKALSSLVENNPGDLVLAQDVGLSAVKLGLPGQAYSLLKRVAMSRPYQPQTYTMLARCLAEMRQGDLAILFYEIALSGEWDSRFANFKQIATVEYVDLLHSIQAGDVTCHAQDFATARWENLRKNSTLDADVVVTLSWNTDRTDVDLHVIDPTGEECNYQHRDTKIGGHLTEDVTQGFGPEMFTLKRAPQGAYRVKVHYYGSDQNRTSTRSKVYVRVYRNFGTDAQRSTTHVIPLSAQQEMRDVVTIKIP